MYVVVDPVHENDSVTDVNINRTTTTQSAKDDTLENIQTYGE